jgi:hypothetical protein
MLSVSSSRVLKCVIRCGAVGGRRLECAINQYEACALVAMEVNSVNNDGARGYPEDGPDPNLSLVHAPSCDRSTLPDSSPFNGTASDRYARYGGPSDGRHNGRRRQ